MRISPSRWLRLTIAAGALVLAFASPSAANHVVPAPPACDQTNFLMTLDAPGSLRHIICSGDTVGTFEFQGIPDGIGSMPGDAPGTVDVFVNHEESEVPFPAPPAVNAAADFQDSSVSRLTVNTTTGAVLDAEVGLPASAGFIRFCSATMAGPAEGLTYTFFTNEETDDVVAVDPDATYGPDPSVAPQRQAGYSVVLDPETGDYTHVAGMGRHNHENTVPIPGGWNQIAILSGDDTFNPPSSQLYLYLANHERHIWQDRGSLWAFRVTATDEGAVDEDDPFNGANDYGDIQSGDDWRGEFIRVPKEIARGETAERPQAALENWSNANNVFQFVRVEDIAYDPDQPRVVYFADTSTTRIVPDPTTGRLRRLPSGAGLYNNGRIFRMEFDAKNPRKVDSFSILLNADTGGPAAAGAPMHQPDNLGISANSLMVQEDAAPPSPNSRVWRYDFATETWSVVGHVNESDWETSGIVYAPAFGPGAWLLDVQGHGDDDWVQYENPTATRPWHLKQESGQLLVMTIAGS
jgi:uncharacterized protein DUF839